MQGKETQPAEATALQIFTHNSDAQYLITEGKNFTGNLIINNLGVMLRDYPKGSTHL
jgi:hypothetical protein